MPVSLGLRGGFKNKMNVYDDLPIEEFVFMRDKKSKHDVRRLHLADSGITQLY